MPLISHNMPTAPFWYYAYYSILSMPIPVYHAYYSILCQYQYIMPFYVYIMPFYVYTMPYHAYYSILSDYAYYSLLCLTILHVYYTILFLF